MNMSVTHLNAIAQRCHATAVEHGFWDDQDAPSIAAHWLAYMASNVSAFGHNIEKVRKGTYGESMYADVGPTLSPQQIVILSKLTLIVSEVAEAIDVILNGTGDLNEELADILIRTLDTAEGCGFDIGHATAKKMTVNDARPRMHGKKA